MSTESEVAVGSADDRGSSPRLCAKLAPDQSAIASRLRQLQHRYVFSASQLRSLVTELNDLQANRNDWTMETYDRVEEILFESRQLFHDMELIHRQQVSDPSVSFGHALHDEFVKLKSIIDATVQELLMELIRQGLQRPSQNREKFVKKRSLSAYITVPSLPSPHKRPNSLAKSTPGESNLAETVNPAESTEDQNDANVDPNELMEELSVKVEKLYDLMLVRQDQLAALKMELSSMTETSETYRETVDKQQHLLKQIGELRNVLNECISTLSDMDSAENSNLTNTVTKSVSGKDLKPAVRVVKSAIDGAFTATHGPKFAAEPFSSAQLQRKRLIQSLLQQHRQLKMSSAMAVADEGAPPLNAIKRTKPRCVFSKTPRFPNEKAEQTANTLFLQPKAVQLHVPTAKLHSKQSAAVSSMTIQQLRRKKAALQKQHIPDNHAPVPPAPEFDAILPKAGTVKICPPTVVKPVQPVAPSPGPGQYYSEAMASTRSTVGPRFGSLPDKQPTVQALRRLLLRQPLLTPATTTGVQSDALKPHVKAFRFPPPPRVRHRPLRRGAMPMSAYVSEMLARHGLALPEPELDVDGALKRVEKRVCVPRLTAKRTLRRRNPFAPYQNAEAELNPNRDVMRIRKPTHAFGPAAIGQLTDEQRARMDRLAQLEWWRRHRNAQIEADALSRLIDQEQVNMEDDKTRVQPFGRSKPRFFQHNDDDVSASQQSETETSTEDLLNRHHLPSAAFHGAGRGYQGDEEADDVGSLWLEPQSVMPRVKGLPFSAGHRVNNEQSSNSALNASSHAETDESTDGMRFFQRKLPVPDFGRNAERFEPLDADDDDQASLWLQPVRQFGGTSAGLNFEAYKGREGDYDSDLDSETGDVLFLQPDDQLLHPRRPAAIFSKLSGREKDKKVEPAPLQPPHEPEVIRSSFSDIKGPVNMARTLGRFDADDDDDFPVYWGAEAPIVNNPSLSRPKAASMTGQARDSSQYWSADELADEMYFREGDTADIDAHRSYDFLRPNIPTARIAAWSFGARQEEERKKAEAAERALRESREFVPPWESEQPRQRVVKPVFKSKGYRKGISEAARERVRALAGGRAVESLDDLDAEVRASGGADSVISQAARKISELSIQPRESFDEV